MKYKTQKGNTLEVLASKSTFNSNCKYYQFILHEEKEFGEDIEVLLQAHLTTPDYFIQKFTADF